MAGHLLTLGGESGAIALLHSLDVHAHGDAQDEELGFGVEKREPGDASVEGNKDKQASKAGFVSVASLTKQNLVSIFAFPVYLFKFI